MKRAKNIIGIGKHAALKVKEHEQKARLAQQARKEQQESRSARVLAAFLQPHIERFIHSDIHFENAGRVNVRCTYDTENALYRVQAQLKVNSERRLDRTIIEDSLGQSMENYFLNLHADMNEESFDLQALSAEGRLNPAKMYSFNRRYDILNHQLKLKGIEYNSKNPMLVNVWFGFRW